MVNRNCVSAQIGWKVETPMFLQGIGVIWEFELNEDTIVFLDRVAKPLVLRETFNNKVLCEDSNRNYFLSKETRMSL